MAPPLALRTAVLLTLASVAVPLAACRKDGAAPSQPAPAEQRYRFRAEVVKLPDAQRAKAQVTLRHEAIPDFRDQSGAVVGMDSMVMPFDVAPSASFDGIGAGDKVEAELAADWTKPSFRIVSVRKLPGDTALDFASRAGR